MTTTRPAFLGGPQELADYLGIPLATVYNWRAHGRGPRGYRVGRGVRYRLGDVEEWLEQNSDENRAARRG